MSRLLFLCGLLTVCGATNAVAQEYVLSPRWIAGGTGSGIGEYGIPESVAIDSLGRVVVTDKGRMLLHVYALADGRPLFSVGGLGTALGKFNRPNGIAVDAGGRVLVVEQINQRVQIFDRDYHPVGAFGHGGSGPGAFGKPMGIAVDRSGRVFVTDASREDVQVFDGSGLYLWSFSSTPRLASVESIEIDSLQQRILVCDEGHARLNFYDMSGRYLSSFGSQGRGPGQFGDVPNAVRLDSRGRIYVNDQGNARISVYRPDTRLLASFRCAGRDMQSADGMALSEPDNILLVADQGNDRVLAFDLGEIQCRLAQDEMEPRAAAISGLEALADSVPLRTGGLPAWRGARIDLEAVGTDGDPGRVESAIVHARTGHDPRGIVVTVVETGPATNRFTGHFELAAFSDASAGALGMAGPDTLRLHVAGGTDALVAAVVQLDPPVAAGVGLESARAGIVPTDFPTIVWRCVDPAGVRRQSAAEVRVRRADGTLLWQGAALRGTVSRCRYAGPPLPRGEWLRAEVRVACGAAWSSWSAAPLRRNPVPSVVGPVGIGSTAILRSWPVRLRARLRVESDPDIVCVEFELDQPGRPLLRVPATLPRDGVVESAGPLPQLREDEWVRWRVVMLDEVERIAGPWWLLSLDAQPGPPRGRTRNPALAVDGDADSSSAAATPSVAADRDPRSGEAFLPAARGARLHLAPAGPAVAVEVIDVRGRRVRQARTDSEGTWTWDARDASGALLPRGVYLVRALGSHASRGHKVLWTGR